MLTNLDFKNFILLIRIENVFTKIVRRLNVFRRIL